jgi:hypothetical protein
MAMLDKAYKFLKAEEKNFLEHIHISLKGIEFWFL